MAWERTGQGIIVPRPAATPRSQTCGNQLQVAAQLRLAGRQAVYCGLHVVLVRMQRCPCLCRTHTQRPWAGKAGGWGLGGQPVEPRAWPIQCTR